ncbi:glycogen phosphorylase [Mizugakiibacter sediminis]|uniref:Glycogen phosphorylase n=1 Tax=Mizugakiibacter sediminis TaxID=1475481 RepID=A0A0K8QQ02_9GAMM|nr:alpha-glucan family phosphorylase [Mizugakiibacter sediminis]GAP66948.1 glycogen phosphorylase [Mizugakiibacter sediminis]
MPSATPRPLPDSLVALRELALNLHWTWSHASDVLWRRIDDELWQRTENPWALLQNVPQSRLEKLAEDAAFAGELRHAIDEHRSYLQEAGWYARQPEQDLGTVAYFSMEFGLSEAVSLYAGGLGVLAGDFLKTASDLGLPVVGVGLLYQEGYFRQIIDAGGRQTEAYPNNEPASLPIQPALGADGEWLKVGLRLPGRTLFLRVWQANVGRVRLYLLDSNDIRNGAADRGITAQLYGGGAEMRLLQEIVLGVGGLAMLEALGVEPTVCHLNEGHAALVTLERARRFMRRAGTSFWEAWWATRAGNVFTTHTPVAAGFDAFPPSLVYKYSRDYVGDFAIPPRELLALGRRDPRDDDEPFNMVHLALRGCAQTNAVSALHGEVSRHLFGPLYPRWPTREVPLRHVTNGVHVPSWDSVWSDRLWTTCCGKERWRGELDVLPESIAAADDETLWALATTQRRDLVDYARERLAWHLGQRGESPALVAEAAQVLDPNILTLGLARRFAGYKRPNLLLHDADRLARLLCDAQRPVQLIVAGKAHPQDEQGKRLIHAWIEFMRRPGVRMRAVFLEDYDMALAQRLVQGVDVWINTPQPPWEACGTSGMKVLVNGGLNLSVLDGWWAEAYDPACGWGIESAAGRDDAGADAADADCLYRILEREVVPDFYDRDARGVPRRWVARMRASMSRLAPRFSSNRMLREYLQRFYRVAAAALRRRTDDGARLARDLRAWQTAVEARWHEVRLGDVEAKREEGAWRLSVPVYLGGLTPDMVRVEAYADPAPEREGACEPMRCGDAIPGSVHGYLYEARVPDARPAADYTPRIRPWHAEAFLPAELALITWQR